MSVLVATGPDDIDSTCARLAGLGALETRIVSPSEVRRVVLATVADDRDAERVAVQLRSEGMLAVTRPDGGPRLERWMQDSEPITFDGRLSISLAWSEHDRSGLPGLIELGPGGFGDGTHPTTAMLIDELLRRIKGGERVLDVGCGSGVLGLCALRLGAAELVATDIKPDAVDAARHNAALNGLSERVIATAAPLDEIDGEFEVIVANVGRAAIVDLAAQLVRLLSAGGWLAVSGISPPQCSMIADFLGPLVEIDRAISGEWGAVVLGAVPTTRG